MASGKREECVDEWDERGVASEATSQGTCTNRREKEGGIVIKIYRT